MFIQKVVSWDLRTSGTFTTDLKHLKKVSNNEFNHIKSFYLKITAKVDAETTDTEIQTAALPLWIDEILLRDFRRTIIRGSGGMIQFLNYYEGRKINQKSETFKVGEEVQFILPIYFDMPGLKSPEDFLMPVGLFQNGSLSVGNSAGDMRKVTEIDGAKFSKYQVDVEMVCEGKPKITLPPMIEINYQTSSEGDAIDFFLQAPGARMISAYFDSDKTASEPLGKDIADYEFNNIFLSGTYENISGNTLVQAYLDSNLSSWENLYKSFTFSKYKALPIAWAFSGKKITELPLRGNQNISLTTAKDFRPRFVTRKILPKTKSLIDMEILALGRNPESTQWEYRSGADPASTDGPYLAQRIL